MTNSIQSIAVDKLLAHPDNPNRMSRSNFIKLKRNIEGTGRYEPIVVRPHPAKEKCFQIINGHHRCRALSELDYKAVDAVVWDIDDEQADILLTTLNRLGGSDELEKKLTVLKRLNERMRSEQMSKLLPQTAKQIEHLVNLNKLSVPATIEAPVFANPMMFFVDDTQQQIIENAVSLAEQSGTDMTKAARRAAALTAIAQYFIRKQKQD